MKRTTRTITPRQADTLRAIADHIFARGTAPTIRELARALEVPSISSVHHHIRALANKGFVSHVPQAKRSLGITEAGWMQLRAGQEARA